MLGGDDTMKSVERRIQGGETEYNSFGKEEVTGGSSPNYYRKSILLPSSKDRHNYHQVDIECGDVSDAWNLNGNMFNVLKSNLRGDNKEGVDNKYALDKILWFTLREKKRLGLITHSQFWEQAKAIGLSKEV